MAVTQNHLVRNCPLCEASSSNSVPYNRRFEYGVWWRYHICRACGLVYQSPQMNDAEITHFYEREYWELQKQTGCPDKEQVELQQGRANHLLRLIPSHFRVRRLLEVGCAAGFGLRVARERLGADVVGVELSAQFRTFCHQNGLNVYASLDELTNADVEKFDVVLMSHVIEHFRNPVDLLRRLRGEFLVPSGHLLLEIPNLYAHNSFEAAHPICFNDRTIRDALHKAGFYVIDLRVHNVPRVDINRPLYISVLATPQTKEVRESQFTPPFVWFERVRRAYVAKRGPWYRRLLKGIRIGATSLLIRDMSY